MPQPPASSAVEPTDRASQQAVSATEPLTALVRALARQAAREAWQAASVAAAAATLNQVNPHAQTPSASS